MQLLQRYIGKNVIAMTFLVMIILFGLELLISFIGELGDIGTGNYGVWQAMQYVFFEMPHQLYTLFPMAGLVGSLLALGQLALSSELVVIRASGVSIGQIIASVMKAAILMMIVALVVGETFGPSGMHAAVNSKTLAMNSGQAINTSQGMWLRNGDTYINIQKIDPNKQMLGISRYTFNVKHQMVSASYAREADYQAGHWVLKGIQQTNFIEGVRASSENIESEAWTIKLNPNLKALTRLNADELSLATLRHYIQQREHSGLSSKRYTLVFWQRLLQPFATFVMIFLAIPFVFGSMRSVSMGVRVIVGVAVGFSFYIANELIGSMSIVWQMPPWFGALLPIILFAGLGFYLMRRMA